MFGSKKNKAEHTNNALGSSSKAQSLNTLVKGTVVDGNIKTESDIRIDGSLIGNLNCSAKVIIGPSGVVGGEIICQNAVIEGQFDGKLEVMEVLTLKETSIINGDATYDKLVVHQGAVINAVIRRGNSEIKSPNQIENNLVNIEEKAEV